MLPVLRRDAAGTATEHDRAVMSEASTRRLNGGRNNPLYACEVAGESVCVKLHRPNRQRARREWDALGLLAARGVGVAPQPLCYDPDDQPAMALSLLPGTGLGGASLTVAQVEALARANRQVHAVTPSPRDGSLLPVRLTDVGMLHQVRQFLSRLDDDATPLRKELAGAWAMWDSGPDPLVITLSAPVVLGQGDPNLTNCLWDGDQLRLVDFEYGGWSNRVYELALLVEHVQSRATPDERWRALIDSSGLSASEQRRLGRYDGWWRGSGS
jgi:Ser/Thr protein kinase RdoA (MazF antagonist)